MDFLKRTYSLVVKWFLIILSTVCVLVALACMHWCAYDLGYESCQYKWETMWRKHQNDILVERLKNKNEIESLEEKLNTPPKMPPVKD